MTTGFQAKAAPERPWARVACWLATGLTLVICAHHTGGSSRWHDDLGLIRTLGAWPIGGQGTCSAMLAQLTRLLPVGTLAYRAALVANLGAAWAAAALFELIYAQLARNAGTPRLTAVLSLLGALMLSVSRPMQEAATVAGGSALAAGMALSALAIHSHAMHRANDKSWIKVGLLVTAAVAEQFWTGMAALLFIVIERALANERMNRAELRQTLLGALVAFVPVVAALTRMLRPHRTLPDLPSLGASLRSTGLALLTPHWDVAAYWADTSLVVCALAVPGAVWCLGKASLRNPAWGFLSLIALSFAYGTVPADESHPYVTGVHLLGLASVVLFCTTALQTLALLLQRSPVSYVGSTAIIIPLVFGLQIAVIADDSDIAAESRRQRGADLFTEEAVWLLPRDSVLILDSRELLYRIWAERLARALRPDLVLVSTQQLRNPADQVRLLRREPALASVIRDWIIRGRPSEYALSQLADVRPVFVQVGRDWDARLREHLSSFGVWLRYHSQNIGRSDRYIAVNSARAGIERIIEGCNGSVPPDVTTLQVLAKQLKEQAKVAASLGDRQVVYLVLELLERTGLERAAAAQIRQLMDQRPRGAVPWVELQSL